MCGVQVCESIRVARVELCAGDGRGKLRPTLSRCGGKLYSAPAPWQPSAPVDFAVSADLDVRLGASGR